MDQNQNQDNQNQNNFFNLDWAVNTYNNLNQTLFGGRLPNGEANRRILSKFRDDLSIRLVSGLSTPEGPAMGKFDYKYFPVGGDDYDEDDEEFGENKKKKGNKNKIDHVVDGTLVISLNSDYANSRTEKEWIETILHEMIHAYVACVLKIYDSGHGPEFTNIANKLKAKGYNVGIYAEVATGNQNGGQETQESATAVICGFVHIKTNIPQYPCCLIPYTSQEVRQMIFNSVNSSENVVYAQYSDIQNNPTICSMMQSCNKAHNGVWGTNNGSEYIFGWYGRDFQTCLNSCVKALGQYTPITKNKRNTNIYNVAAFIQNGRWTVFKQ